MRISPYLCGEAIDAFLEAAARRRASPCVPRAWRGWTRGGRSWQTARPAQLGRRRETPIPPRRRHRRDRTTSPSPRPAAAPPGRRDLWIAGHDDETARRAASRVVADLAAALDGSGGQRLPGRSLGESRGAPAAARWRACSRCATRVRDPPPLELPQRGLPLQPQGNTGRPARKPDLLLDVGVEDAANGTKRIAWGKEPGREDLFIPLPRELWIRGRSHPTGMPRVQAGND